MKAKYIIEVRDADGELDFESERIKKKEHPFLFEKAHYSIDQLCRYMSFGQGRDKPSGPMQLDKFMSGIGISYRVKTW